ncbi:MAG: thrombospondin type 3 repeat-containing protein, partial [Candidatus Hydrogenedentota bacterium]
MKVFKCASALLVALTLMAVLMPSATAGQGGAESITITIDRRTMPSSLLFPGRFFTKAATVTVHDFVIRDYLGNPIDGFTVQTSSGRTEIPIHLVEEIRLSRWIKRNTKDIEYVENVVEGEIVLTDGREMSVLMNADFGTIEGKTDFDDFFLEDPHTVRHLVFNRYNVYQDMPESPKAHENSPLVDSDGDGVPDNEDKCPDTPKGVEVDDNGCPLDSDGDGVPDYKDDCPDTPKGANVDDNGCPLDSDGDGVSDYEDKCPDTPEGAPVNSVGCWTIKGINFDYDKWDIKPQYFGLMDQSAQVLKISPT